VAGNQRRQVRWERSEGGRAWPWYGRHGSGKRGASGPRPGLLIPCRKVWESHHTHNVGGACHIYSYSQHIVQGMWYNTRKLGYTWNYPIQLILMDPIRINTWS
jgi:hypothetical protein